MQTCVWTGCAQARDPPQAPVCPHPSRTTALPCHLGPSSLSGHRHQARVILGREVRFLSPSLHPALSVGSACPLSLLPRWGLSPSPLLSLQHVPSPCLVLSCPLFFSFSPALLCSQTGPGGSARPLCILPRALAIPAPLPSGTISHRPVPPTRNCFQARGSELAQGAYQVASSPLETDPGSGGCWAQRKYHCVPGSGQGTASTLSPRVGLGWAGLQGRAPGVREQQRGPEDAQTTPLPCSKLLTSTGSSPGACPAPAPAARPAFYLDPPSLTFQKPVLATVSSVKVSLLREAFPSTKRHTHPPACLPPPTFSHSVVTGGRRAVLPLLAQGHRALP